MWRSPRRCADSLTAARPSAFRLPGNVSFYNQPVRPRADPTPVVGVLGILAQRCRGYPWAPKTMATCCTPGRTPRTVRLGVAWVSTAISRRLPAVDSPPERTLCECLSSMCLLSAPWVSITPHTTCPTVASAGPLVESCLRRRPADGRVSASLPRRSPRCSAVDRTCPGWTVPRGQGGEGGGGVGDLSFAAALRRLGRRSPRSRGESRPRHRDHLPVPFRSTTFARRTPRPGRRFATP